MKNETAVYYVFTDTGAYSCKMTAGSQDRVLSQAVSVTSGEVYTLSAYFSGTLNIAYMRITNGSVTEQTPAIEAGGTGWNRESFTFRAAASSITVAIVVPAGSGDVYVDSIQLEKGEIPHRYNLIMNSDFIHLTIASFPELAQKLDSAFAGIIPVIGGEIIEED